MTGQNTDARFRIMATEALNLRRHNRLEDMYVLSPFAWLHHDGRYHMLVRAVPRRDDNPALKISEVWHATSDDGLTFETGTAPVIWPGPQAEDLDGCEDPTVVVHDGQVHVLYSGFNQADDVGCLLRASGAEPTALSKVGVVHHSTAEVTNPKEASVALAANDHWWLFFEYASGGASRIGASDAAVLTGPYAFRGRPFDVRADHWDCWHLSPGPLISAEDGRQLIFYNGADKDTRWRIGWIVFDPTLNEVCDRSDAPLIVPHDLGEGDTDIAFVASAIEHEDEVWLYYSVADRYLYRARLRRLNR